MNDDIKNLIPGCNLLNNEEKELINNNLKIVHFQKKDIIFKQNTPVSHLMFIKSGIAKVYKTDKHDKTIILQILLKNDFLGIISVFAANYQPFSAMAIESSEIVYIDMIAIRKVLQSNGAFATRLLEIVSKTGLDSFHRFDNFNRKQLPGRIADVILFFAEEVFKSDNFIFPLTRKELAEFAGTTKESFIRTLSEFRNDKIISIEGKKLLINSMEIIKTLSKLG